MGFVHTFVCCVCLHVYAFFFFFINLFCFVLVFLFAHLRDMGEKERERGRKREREGGGNLWGHSLQGTCATTGRWQLGKHSCWLYSDGQKPQIAAPKKMLSPEKGLNSNRGQQSKLKLLIFVSLTWTCSLSTQGYWGNQERRTSPGGDTAEARTSEVTRIVTKHEAWKHSIPELKRKREAEPDSEVSLV